MVNDILKKLASGEDIGREKAAGFIDQIAADKVTAIQIAAFLTALRLKGETVAEIAGCVEALRRHAHKVPHSQAQVFDCCGTGGDGSNSFNISTAVSLIIAACGVTTAKHGNRAVSSACGSADILEAAGAGIDLGPIGAAKLLDELGFCFLFAPRYHPVAGKVAPVRRELGFPTLFNQLGPLLNPANATHQIVGAATEQQARKLAQVAGYFPQLQLTAFHNSKGYDELLPIGDNLTFTVVDSELKENSVAIPKELQIDFDINSIGGGNSSYNLSILNSVLAAENLPITKITCFNAAFGLVIAGECNEIETGYQLAYDTLASGKVRRLLDDYVKLSQELN